MPVTAYIPDAKTPMLRSYIKNFYVGYGAGAIVTRDGSVVSVHQVYDPPHYIDTKIFFYSAFMNWSSNCYTLDFPIFLALSAFDGGSFVYDFDYTISTGVATQNGLPYITLTFSGATTYYPVTLPPAPPDYWLQLP